MKHRWRMRFLAFLAPVALLLGSCGLSEAMDWGTRLFEMTADRGGDSLAEPEKAGTLTEILSQLLDSGTEKPASTGEMLGVWVSYLDLSPLTVGKTVEEFTESARQICGNTAGLGLNTLFVQVRPFADSFYPSDLFPWSRWASGELGQALAYDPVEILWDEAAAEGLSFQIWINPMRGMSEGEVAAVPAEFPIRQWYDDPEKRAENLLVEDGILYLNPASAEVRKLIADGAVEALDRYQADGVHIDDYFYPPNLPPEADQSSYQAYLDSGGSLSQAEWRRENTYLMVKELGDAVHAAGSSALFGVSPRGIESQNYNDLFIDVERWMAEPGLLDYIAPQLYFGFEHETAPFDRAAEEWNALCAQYGVPLVIGLAAYKVGAEDQFAGTGSREWVETPGLLAEQLVFARGLSSYGGVIFFRYDSLFPQGQPALAAEAVEALAAVLPQA